MWTFDITYSINIDRKDDIIEIVLKYKTCYYDTFYTDPYGESHSYRYYNISFSIESEDDLIKIINELKSLDGVFVRFINYHDTNAYDPIRIYSSPFEMRLLSPKTRKIYEKTLVSCKYEKIIKSLV